MKILAKYITRQAVITLFFSVCAFTFVLLLAQVLKELSELLINRQVGLRIVGLFLVLLLPSVLSFTLPMAMLTTALLVFGRMSADNEVTAMRASGIGLGRTAAPVILLSALVAAVCLYANMTLAPQCRFRFRTLFLDMAAKQPTALLEENTYIKDFPGYVIYVRRKKANVIEDVSLFTLDTNGNVVSSLRAERGLVKGEPEQKKLLLDLRNVRGDVRDASDPTNVRKISPGSTADRYPVELDLAQAFRQARMSRRLSDLLFSELLDQIRQLRDQGIYPAAALMEEHQRLAMALACVAFTLIGIPLGVKTSRRETSIGVAISLGLALGYYFTMVFANVLRNRPYLYPEAILWAPNLIFEVLGLWLLWRVTLCENHGWALPIEGSLAIRFSQPVQFKPGPNLAREFLASRRHRQIDCPLRGLDRLGKPPGVRIRHCQGIQFGGVAIVRQFTRPARQPYRFGGTSQALVLAGCQQSRQIIERHRMIRVQAQRLAILRNRLLELSQTSQREGQVVLRLEKIGFVPQGFAILDDGLRQLPLRDQGVAQIAVGIRIIRPEPQGLVILGNGLVKFTLVGQCVCQVVVRVGIVRLQLQRFPETGNGLVEFSLHGQRNPQAAMRLGQIRLEPQRRAKMSHGAFGSSWLLDQMERQIVLGNGPAFGLGHRRPVDQETNRAGQRGGDENGDGTFGAEERVPLDQPGCREHHQPGNHGESIAGENIKQGNTRGIDDQRQVQHPEPMTETPTDDDSEESERAKNAKVNEMSQATQQRRGIGIGVLIFRIGDFESVPNQKPFPRHQPEPTSRIALDVGDHPARPIPRYRSRPEPAPQSGLGQFGGVLLFVLGVASSRPQGRVHAVGTPVIADEKIRTELGGGEVEFAADHLVAQGDWQQNDRQARQQEPDPFHPTRQGVLSEVDQRPCDNCGHKDQCVFARQSQESQCRSAQKPPARSRFLLKKSQRQQKKAQQKQIKNRLLDQTVKVNGRRIRGQEKPCQNPDVPGKEKACRQRDQQAGRGAQKDLDHAHQKDVVTQNRIQQAQEVGIERRLIKHLVANPMSAGDFLRPGVVAPRVPHQQGNNWCLPDLPEIDRPQNKREKPDTEIEENFLAGRQRISRPTGLGLMRRCLVRFLGSFVGHTACRRGLTVECEASSGA